MFLLFFLLAFLFPQSAMAQTVATSAATVETPAVATSTALASPSATTIPLSPTPTINPALILFQQYRQDYLYNRDLYQQAYLNYAQKKDVYTKYQTLTTQADKISATKAALTARNNMLRTYLMALRVYLDVYKSNDTTNTEKYQIELQKLESWLSEQNSVVNSLNNDDDIKSNGQDFQAKYVTIQQALYSALVQNEYNLRLHTLNVIKSYAAEIQVSPNGAKVNDLLTAITIKSDNVTSNLQSALDETTPDLYASLSFTNFYPTSKKYLSLANQYLTELVSDLTSVIIQSQNQ